MVQKQHSLPSTSAKTWASDSPDIHLPAMSETKLFTLLQLHVQMVAPNWIDSIAAMHLI